MLAVFHLPDQRYCLLHFHKRNVFPILCQISAASAFTCAQVWGFPFLVQIGFELYRHGQKASAKMCT